MKKGFGTMEYVIAAVIILLFAGTSLYAFAPRLGRGPGLIEQFFPEECEATGMTRDDYLRQITDFISQTPPDVGNARTTYGKMQECFSDADIPLDQKRFLLNAQKETLKALVMQSTRKAFADIIKLYDENRALIPPDAWGNGDLLIFIRALSDAGRPEARDLVKLLLDPTTLVPYPAREKIEKLTDAHYAEALYLQGLLVDDGKAKERYAALVKKFGASTDADIQLFVGLALKGIDANKNLEASINAFTFARQSPSANVKQIANYNLGVAYWRQGVSKTSAKDEDAAEKAFAEAARSYEAVLKQKNSLYYDKALKGYLVLEEDYRTGFPSCDRDEDLRLYQPPYVPCLCVLENDVPALATAQILPDGANVYCCDRFVSAQPCPVKPKTCAEMKNCVEYGTQEACKQDTCKVAEKLFRQAYQGGFRCRWNDAEMSTITSGKVLRPAECVLRERKPGDQW